MATPYLNKIYEYHLNGEDQIEYVNSNWTEFAIENAGDCLVPNNIIGQPVWKYITDEATVSIYQSVLRRVRRSRARVELPFRCDSPGIRRYMRMEIEPMNKEHIRFKSRLIHEEPRTFIHALSSHFKRDNAILTMCSWCKKVKLSKERWVEIETAVCEMDLFQNHQIPMISHGICKNCYSRTWSQYH